MRYLVCDDEQQARNSIGNHLVCASEDRDCEVTYAAQISKARELIKSYDYDLIIIDIVFPKSSGFELMQELNTKWETKFIVVTNWPNDHNCRVAHLY